MKSCFMRLTAALALLAAFVMSASAATQTWTGNAAVSGNLNFSNPANWVGQSVPAAGDRIVLDSRHSWGELRVDIPNVTLDAIDLLGNGFYVSGYSLTLTGAQPIRVVELGPQAVPGFSLDGVVITTPGATISALPSVPFYELTIYNSTFAGGVVTLASGNGRIDLAGSVRQTAPTAFTVSGNQIEFSASPSAISGPVDSTADSLAAFAPLAFGGAQVILRGGQMYVGNDGSAPATIVMGPVLLHAPRPQGMLTLSGVSMASVEADVPLVMNGPTDISGTQSIHAGRSVSIKGPLTGNGTLHLQRAPDVVTLDGPGGNNLSGSLVVDSGAVLRATISGATGGIDRLGVDGTLDIGSTVQVLPELDCAGELAMVLGAGRMSLTRTIKTDGCALDLTFPASLAPTPNTTYTILENPAGVAHAAFVGLPEGAAVAVNGTLMPISYHAGPHGTDTALVGTVPPLTTTPGVQDMWWAGPGENGWGMSMVKHGDTLFGALFIYDAAGKPTWLVMPGGTWDSTHTIYTGSLYTPSGTPFFSYDASHFVVGNAMGIVQITFQGGDNAILLYRIGGTFGHKLITREIFAAGAASALDRSDLWWGGSAQNGWGITILQQGSTLFPVWFTYDANGKATWYVMPGGTWTSTDTYEGHVYRTTGSPWAGAQYDPTKLQVIDVGTYRIQFTGNGASFIYTVDGHTGTIPLVREPF